MKPTQPTSAIASESTPSRPPSDDECNIACRSDLDRAFTATEGYWNVDAATADGFAELSSCQSTPQGGVGFQYVNPRRLLDQTVDVEQPESLLYMPEGFSGPAPLSHHRRDAARRLVAVEYGVLILDEAQEPPVLFGQQFQGPFDSALPGFQEYRLRVWLFSLNPDGVFAEAHPAEACFAHELVAPHAYDENVREVFAILSVDPELARSALEIPPDFQIRVNEVSNQATVWVVGRSSDWSASENGSASPAGLAAPFVPLVPPDMSERALSPYHMEFPTAVYPFSWVNNRPDYVAWWRARTGLGSDVIRHGDVGVEFKPIAGQTDPKYRFTSPDFSIEATVTETIPVDVTNSFRGWHESSRGMALVREWVENGDGAFLPPGTVTVTPTPGTPLATLLRDCNPGPAAGSCMADRGYLVTSRPGARWAWVASVSPDWWNPHQGD